MKDPKFSFVATVKEREDGAPADYARYGAAVRDKLVAFLDANKTIDAQQWKDLTGASRKFTIPLAEYFDAEKLTLRVGDVRRRR